VESLFWTSSLTGICIVVGRRRPCSDDVGEPIVEGSYACSAGWKNEKRPHTEERYT